MQHAICNLAMVPIRAEASDKAEMCSQLLFGEMLEILGQEGSWLRIQSTFDRYEGWIDHKQCRLVSDEFENTFSSSPSPVCFDLLQIVFNESRKIALPICFGSTLPNMKDKRFTIDEDAYSFDGQAFLSGNSTREAIVDTALMYLNSPYLWGGRSPFGIDCSGLVQMVYRIHGYKLLRDAAMQSSQGTQVSFVEAAEPGDVAFFENQEGQIIHTGILLAGGKIIHASGRVRIDDIDHEGIYNRELNKYTHKLRLIKSFL